MTTRILIASALLSAAVSGTVAFLVADLAPGRTASGAGEPEAIAPSPLAELRAELTELREAQRAMDRRLESASFSAGSGGDRLDVAALRAEVDRYLESLGTEAEPVLVAREDGPGDGVEALVAELLGGELDEAGRNAVWKSLAERGLLEEALAMFEDRVEQDPANPDLRLDLGRAYLEMIQEVGNGPLAGRYATLADEAFDQALELDENHWGARYTKAVALSFWPPMFGKQGAAIEQFELLVAQQAASPIRPEHADTHLWLGNMYRQIGEGDKALEAWRAGAAIFPEHAELAAQIELAEGQ